MSPLFSARKRQATRQVIRGGDISIICARLDVPLTFFSGQMEGR